MRRELLLRLSILHFAFLISHFSFAQSLAIDESYSQKTIITSIKVYGNKRTKDFVVAREMTIRVGDTLERE